MFPGAFLGGGFDSVCQGAYQLVNVLTFNDQWWR
jgi:hypothetical protein